MSQIKVSGNELLSGDGESSGPLGQGIDYVLNLGQGGDALFLPLLGEADLGLFGEDNFSAVQNYNPDAGTFNFSFTSKEANGATSTFTFKDTHVADTGKGGSQSVTYGLANATAGVTFSGTNASSESYSSATKSGVTTTTGTYKAEASYTYSNTQGTTSKTDDVSISFTFATTTGSYTFTDTGLLTEKETGSTFAASYTGNGYTLSTKGTVAVDRAFSDFGDTQTKGIVTTVFTNYSLAYKDPDTQNTFDNFTISFSGTSAANEVGTDNGPTFSLALKNVTVEDSFAKIVTAAATLDFSEGFDGRSDLNELFALLDDGSGGIGGLGDQLSGILGLNEDGPGALDSIFDAANAITLKNVSDGSGGFIGGDAFTGAGNDTVTGSSGDDFIDGGIGNDVVNAGAGDDFITAGLGDAINGGAGNDIVDLDALVDGDGNPFSYDLFLRTTSDKAERPYTVTGTATALVLTDLTTKQSIKFNNVEEFILNEETISAGKLLAPNSRDVNAADILFGFSSGEDGFFQGLEQDDLVDFLDPDNDFDSGVFQYKPFLNESDAPGLLLLDFGPTAFNYDPDSQSNQTLTWTSIDPDPTRGATTFKFEHIGSSKTDPTLRYTLSNNFETLTVTDAPLGSANIYGYKNNNGTSSAADDVTFSFSETNTEDLKQIDQRFFGTDTYAYTISYSGNGVKIDYTGKDVDLIDTDSASVYTGRETTITSYTFAVATGDNPFTHSISNAVFTYSAESGTSSYKVGSASVKDVLIDFAYSNATGSIDGDIGYVEDQLRSRDGTVGSIFGNLRFDIAWGAANTVTAKVATTIAEIGILEGGGGADTITGSSGADEIWGGGLGYFSDFPPPNEFFGSNRFEDLIGDSINGGAGNDIIYGGWGDRLAGGAGTDTLELDLAEVTSLGVITDVTGSRTNFTITGTVDGSSFSIVAREFEVAIVGSFSYTLSTESEFEVFKTALFS